MTTIDQEAVRAIKDQARLLGFDAVGVASPTNAPHTSERLRAFLDAGWHGDMGWMENREPERATPAGLWPAVNSVIMLGLNYGPKEDPLDALAYPSNGVISVYAQNKDYHDVVKKKLKALARWMIEHYGGELKVFVDTAPVMEKPLGQAAGLGWQGKHTNLVSREKGSWLFLGAIFTTLDLPADDPETDHCGVCSNCLDICPTKAFPAPYKLDARRCISYLTIEHKGPIPREFRRPMGNRIYGCDDCLAVCPWNKFAQHAQTAAFHAREELQQPLLRDLAALDDAGFRALFKASPVKRIGRDRFVRNVLIAIGNSADPELAVSAQALLTDSAPEVRGAAIWALSQLLDEEKFTALADVHRGAESCATVRAEWRGEETTAAPNA